jgi:hypothetical protein
MIGPGRHFALPPHTHTVVRSGRTAVFRWATPSDAGAIARLIEKRFFPAPPSNPRERRARRLRIRSVFLQSRKPNVRFIVVEIDGRLCAVSCFFQSFGDRIFGSNGAVNDAGRDFDPRMPIRIAEHLVASCQAAGWRSLKLFIDFRNRRSASTLAAYFSKKRDCVAHLAEPRLFLSERLAHRRQRDLIEFNFWA